MQTRAGFTLVELSIVLVIIGLIVGGILVGRDLIESAKIRAQISQITELTTAVNTFRARYNNIPGDLPAAQASSLGMAYRSGAKGDGDGDGFINGWTVNSFSNEAALFWNDLSFAGLIAGDYSLDVDSPITAAPGQMDSYLPRAKLGTETYIVVRGAAPADAYYYPDYDCGTMQTNFCFNIARVTSINAGYFSVSDGVTPLEAFQMDTKIDDGMPIDDHTYMISGYSGSALSTYGEVTDLTSPPSAPHCVQATPSISYITKGPMANQPNCLVTIGYK